MQRFISWVNTDDGTDPVLKAGIAHLWFLDCFDRALSSTEETLASVLAKARFWENHRNLVVNERQRKIINMQFDGFFGKLTSGKWAKKGVLRKNDETASQEKSPEMGISRNAYNLYFCGKTERPIIMGKNFTAKSMMADSRFSDYFGTCTPEKISDIESRVNQLILQEQEFCVPISRPHLCNLFCALAIYQSDLAEGIDAETSQQKIVSVMETYLIPRKRMFQRVFRIPGIFPVMRKAIPKMMMKGNGYGWDTVEVDCGKDVCAFDTRQCIFATIFKKRGVPELGPCFCHIDDYLYSELPGIDFRRTGTCCRGDACCDFRFVKIKK